MGGSAGNPFLFDEEEDKENSPPITTVVERPTRPLVILRSRLFGRRIENIPDCVHSSLFPYVSLCMYFDKKYNYVFHFIKLFCSKTSQARVRQKSSSFVIFISKSGSNFLRISRPYRGKKQYREKKPMQTKKLETIANSKLNFLAKSSRGSNKASFEWW